MAETPLASRVLFSRSLYAAEAVRAAVDAYAKLATFEIQLLDDDVEVTISDPDEAVASVLVDEFCNHVLHESIVRRRGGP